MLIDQIDAATQKALAAGALSPIKTSVVAISDGGLDFSIRIIDTLLKNEREAGKRKIAQRLAGKDFNPFLPYDPNMFVTDFGPHHVGLLNKYPVLDRHLLLVTRHFTEQNQLLDSADFQAIYMALEAMPGLGFYNGGALAGASQRHKHLQLIPWPAEGLPIASLLAKATSEPNGLDFPFHHYFVPVSGSNNLARWAYEAYCQGMEYLQLWGSDGRQLGPYNLLCTQSWLLLVPRSCEHFRSISVNALGFAGALLVRNTAEIALIRQKGPMNLLAHVARN